MKTKKCNLSRKEKIKFKVLLHTEEGGKDDLLYFFRTGKLKSKYSVYLLQLQDKYGMTVYDDLFNPIISRRGDKNDKMYKM